MIRQLLGAFAIAVAAVTASAAEDASPNSDEASRWPGFLGADATQLDPETIPLKWSETENIAWTATLKGQGQSSPVIWKDRVFVTAIDGPMKNDCHVTAVELATGKVLWHYKAPSAQPVRSNYFQSRSAPTPAVDRDRIYAFFETGNLVALTHDGQEVWKRSLNEDYGEFGVQIGLAASLAQNATSVFALVDHEGPSYLVAFDKASGEPRWKTDRFSRVSYASPAVLTIAGVEQVVCSSSGSVDGYAVNDGQLLWTFEDIGGNTATTPRLFNANTILIGASAGMHGERMESAQKSNLALRIEKGADGFQARVLWKADKALASFASPVVHQDHAYWVTSAGIVYCFDAKTGERCYTNRIKQSCWATPLGVGDRIYLFGKDGVTTVLAAGPEFRILAENVLFEGAPTPPRHGGHDGSGAAPSEPAATEKPADQGRSAAEGQPSPADVPAARRGQRPPDSDSAKPAIGERSRTSREGGGRPTSVNGRTFSDPVQYGVAAVNGRIVIRTGAKLYCISQGTALAKSQPDAVGVKP